MHTVQDAFGVAVQHHRAGNCREAAAIYEDILRRQPEHAGAWHLLGVTLHQAGESAQAEQHIRRAIILDGSKAVYHNNLGVALRSQGRLAEAEAACRQALRLNPKYADAWSNLALAVHELGRPEEALGLFQQALGLQPWHPDALYNLANLCQELGRLNEAIELYQKAIRARPERAEAYNNLGNALLAARRIAEAIASYEKAIAIAPGYAEAHLNLAVAFAEEGQMDVAEACYREASRLRPEKKLWARKPAGLCPVVFGSNAELDRYRHELEARVDGYLGEPLDVDWRDLAVDGFVPSFNLAHHGRCNRRLLEKFARLFAGHFPQQRPPLGRGKPRIGFLVTRGHEGGFLRSLGGIVERLDANRFEVVVLCSQGVLERCRQGISRDDVDWVGFPERLEAACQRIAAVRCDVLYHWQIGTDPMNYFLPFGRLASIQCTGWGSHGTTGIPTVDYYLSSRLVEAEEADGHFSERLVRLGTLPAFERRQVPPEPATRSDFGLPERGNLYFCPQRLAKFHPDADALFAGVLRADPRGHLVLPEGRAAHAAGLLRQRFERTLGAVATRVIFLPAQKPAEYRRLLSLADVVLDVPHYSAGFTAYDAFSLKLPIVTLPDEFSVGRYTLACYRKMGVEELVPRSAEEYVALAARLGSDREYLEHVRGMVAERADLLFEDVEAVREHERFFEKAMND